MEAIAQRISEPDGWLVVLAGLWMLVCLSVPFLAVWAAVNSAIHYFRGNRIRYISEAKLMARYRRSLGRELDEMESRGEIVWRPSPVIESTRPGFREPEI